MTQPRAGESDVLEQREWSEAGLLAAGFRFHAPRKLLILAQIAAESTEIPAPGGTLRAAPGAWICYLPQEPAAARLVDYERWPVRADIFAQLYRPWDEPLPTTPAVTQLRAAGCQPWYKYRGVWARCLGGPLALRSLESARAQIAPAGAWLLIGPAGEPYSASDREFRRRYIVPRE